MDDYGSQNTGYLLEQHCITKCLEQGYVVSRPIFNNARYDFIIEANNKLYKIQVKSSHWVKNKETFTFNGYSQHSIGNGNKRMKYTNKEIDYFMTEKDNIYYLYPASEKGFTTKTLRIKNGSTNYKSKTIVWAKDYVFEEVIKNF